MPMFSEWQVRCQTPSGSHSSMPHGTKGQIGGLCPQEAVLSGQSTAHRRHEGRYTGIRAGGTWTSLPRVKTAELPGHKYLVKHSSQWEPWQVESVRKGHTGVLEDIKELTFGLR